jgi:hypothetical protein
MYENSKVTTDKRLFIGQIIQYYRGESNNTNLINTNNSGASSNLFNDTEQSLQQPTVGTPGGLPIKTAPSLSSLNTNNEPISAGAQLNVYLYLIESMHKSIPKKKIENQVKFFQRFSYFLFFLEKIYFINLRYNINYQQYHHYLHLKVVLKYLYLIYQI